MTQNNDPQARDIQSQPTGPLEFQVVRKTWLSRKPHRLSSFIAILGCLALALGALLSFDASAREKLVASFNLVYKQNEFWRAWTSLFLHADAAHLIANGLFFAVFAYFLYGYFGIWFFPVAALFWGGITNLLTLATYAPSTQLIGASGMVFWMGGAWLSLYYLIAKHKSRYQRTLRTLGVAVLLFVPQEAFQPSISYRAHAIGFALGIFWGVTYYLISRKWLQNHELTETVVEVEDTAPLHAPDIHHRSDN